MSKLTKITLLALILAGTYLLSSCTATASLLPTPVEDAAMPTGTSQANQTSESAAGKELPATALATPYGDTPAVGICAETPVDAVVSVELFPDIPSPRCLKVTAGQKLRVINATGAAVQLSLGRLEHTLQRDAEILLDKPFGDYLAPGVHILLAEPYSGPEIWLVE